MAFFYRNAKFRFFQLLPLFMLFFTAFNGHSTLNFNFFSINLHYILVYYWVLRHPQNLGYGFIFLAGIVNDVVFGFPLGINSLSLLVIAGMAAYVRVVTVRITLINDWISFVPALLVANFVYFISLSLTNHSIDYFFLFQNSLATFIFYPLLWMFFSVILKIIKS